MHNYNAKNVQKGLTLIELLIALVLGVVVLLSVTQGLVTLNSSSRTQNNNALLQETGDTALSYIAFEMRSALSTPCDRFSSLNDNKGRLTIKPLKGNINAENIPDDATATTLAAMISGVGISVNQANVGAVGDQSNVKTDNLTMVSTGLRLFTNSEVTYNSDKVTVKGEYPGAANDTQTIYAITDCKHMDVFRATPSIAGGTTTLTFPSGTDIERKYGVNDPSMVAPLNVTDIMIDDGDLISKSRFGNSPGPLLNNVEVIRVLFAVDTDGNDTPDSYVTASQVAGLPSSNRVISADIYLLVNLPNLDSAWQSSYKLTLPKTDEPIDSSNGKAKNQEFTFTDRVPRKIFVRSVAIRNNSQML